MKVFFAIILSLFFSKIMFGQVSTDQFEELNLTEIKTIDANNNTVASVNFTTTKKVVQVDPNSDQRELPMLTKEETITNRENRKTDDND